MTFYSVVLLYTGGASLLGLISSYIYLQFFLPEGFLIVLKFPYILVGALFIMSLFLVVVVAVSGVGLWWLQSKGEVVSTQTLILLTICALPLAFGIISLSIKGVDRYQAASRVFQPVVPYQDPLAADMWFAANTYGSEIYKVAKKIELKQALSEKDMTSIKDRINDRFGLEMTLLRLSLERGNPEAAGQLLAAGADPKMPDKTEGSTRDFFYYVYDGSNRLGVPPGYTIKMYPAQFTNEAEAKKYDDAFNTMQADFVRAYLQTGGDANVLMRDGSRGVKLVDDSWHEQEVAIPWAAAFASLSAFEALQVLLNAGADPWKTSDWHVVPSDGREYDDTVMYTLASNFLLHPSYLNELVDRGYFDNRSQIEIQSFLDSLGTYAQRGDEQSKAIQELAKRVLKRNPNYNPKTETKFEGTKRIFQNSYEDADPGVIPWEEIKSDSVQ